MFGCSVIWQSTPALPPSPVSLFSVLACGTQLISCTMLVLTYPSVQFVRGFPSTCPLGPLKDGIAG